MRLLILQQASRVATKIIDITHSKLYDIEFQYKLTGLIWRETSRSYVKKEKSRSIFLPFFLLIWIIIIVINSNIQIKYSEKLRFSCEIDIVAAKV